MKSLQFEKGELYFAEGSGTAYKVKEGSVDVFLVPVKGDRKGRRVLIYEAGEGETIPGIDFTDQSHNRWIFCFRAVRDSRVIPIEDGVTSVLKKRFADRADLVNFETEGFEYAVVEKYNEEKIREDVVISQKEAETKRAASELKQTIGQIARPGRGHEERGKEKPAGRSVHAVLAFFRTCVRRADLAGVSLMTACLSLCAVLMLCTHYRAVIAAAALGLLLLVFGRDRLIGRVAAAAGSKRQEEAFDALFELEEEYYRNNGRAEMAGLCMNVYGVVKRITYAVYCTGSSAFICLVMFAALLRAAPKEGSLYLLFSFVIGGLIIVFASRTAADNRASDSNRENANARLYHYLRNINKIKISGSEENLLRDYYKRRADSAARRLRAIHLSGAGDALKILALAAVIPLAAAQQNAAAWILPLAVLGGLWIQTAQQISKIPQLSYDVKRLQVFFGQSNERNKKEIAEISEIEVDDVYFDYGGKSVIKGLSLKISAGESIGISGESGSGKTTLLKLITGIEKPSRGTVRINGMELSQLDMKAVRKKIGIVTQDEALISGSLIENIRMGSDASAEKVFDAVVKADLASFISGLPMGVNTLLSEEAGSVSGGQKQKILIARALVRDPDLIILDESMSEMDNESIRKISEGLRSLRATKLIVSHRMEPLQYCDKIIVT